MFRRRIKDRRQKAMDNIQNYRLTIRFDDLPYEDIYIKYLNVDQQ